MAQTKFIREAFTVSADGQSSREGIKITLDPAGEVFSCDLPKYVADRVTNGERLLCSASLRGVVDAYESAMEAYQRWRLMAKAQPMIMLMVEGEVVPDHDDAFSFGKVSLWAEHVYVSEPVDGVSSVFLRTGTTDNVLDFGDMGEKIEPPPTVVAYLPDNREVRDKIKQLTGSIDTVRLIMESLRGVPDKLTAFLNIGEPAPAAQREPEPTPAQQSLPLDDPDEVL